MQSHPRILTASMASYLLRIGKRPRRDSQPDPLFGTRVNRLHQRSASRLSVGQANLSVFQA
jgi:hypothetical protein